ncbi:MAG: ribonuclease D [Chloroflexi bacterium]|nr:ribonuclease D [Chloroflexota bacterium]
MTATILDLPSPMIIDDDESLQRARAQLERAARLAIDTESNSMWAYQEQVCLIQLSTDDQDYILDPLAFKDRSQLDFLGNLCADPSVEIVLHAAEYDIICLKRDFGFRFNHLFDTMVAARLLGIERVGLANLLEEHFGVTMDKRHQRADWGKRPLADELLAYAQMDTHYLLDLRDIINREMDQRVEPAEAAELFEEVTQVDPPDLSFDPDVYWRIHGSRDASRRTMTILRELYIYREKQAQKRNRPPHKVMSDQTLMALAEAAPEHMSDLPELPGMTAGQIRRYGRSILRAVKRGSERKLARPPKRRRRPDQEILDRYDALHNWRKQKAEERGITSELILSKAMMWDIAQLAPTSLEEFEEIKQLGPWRREAYAGEIITLLASLPQSDPDRRT